MNKSTNDTYTMMARRSFPGDSDDWFVDSGATYHMCWDRDCFSIYHSLYHPNRIFLGDSSVVNAYGMGMIRIGDKVNLFNVLYVPDLDINILSFEKFLQQNYDVLFSGADCILKQGTKNIIDAFREGNLYRVNGKARKRTIHYSDAFSHPLSVSPQPTDLSLDRPALLPPPVGAQQLVLWYQRLCHLNYYYLRRLLSLADGIPITESQRSVDPGVCLPCLIGKNHKM